MSEQSSQLPVNYAEPGSCEQETRFGLTPVAWMRIFLIASCLVALFWPNLRRLWLKTNIFTGESNWQHSSFVPLIGLYYLYLNRDALRNSRRIADWSDRGKALGVWLQVQAMLLAALFFVYVYAPQLFDPRLRIRLVLMAGLAGLGAALLLLCLLATGRPGPRRGSDGGLRRLFRRLADSSSQWFGMYTLLWGLLLYAWAIWPGQNDFFKDCAIVVVLFGVTLMVGRWRVMKIAWFPIVFLVCAIPWPGLMYSQIAMPLQKFAAEMASFTLRMTGVDAYRTGTKLVIGEGSGVRVLDVAEACAGLKSLMTFISVGAAVAFLSQRALWQKLIIAMSAVPIAIACNAFRVSGQGLLDHYVDHNLSESFAHQFVGMIMLIPAFFLILLVGWILDNLFVEEVDKRSVAAARSTAVATGKKSLVIEVPRALPSSSASAPAPVQGPAPATPPATDLAAATQRLMSSRTGRRAGAPGAAGTEPLQSPSTKPAAGGQEG